MTDKKKIAILYSGARHFGGIENYLLNLFKAYDQSKAQLVLISLGQWDLTRKLQAEGFEVQIFSDKRISLSTITKISKYLKTSGFNLLVSQGVVANAYARTISIFSKVPNLVTVHSNLAGDYPKLVSRSAYRLIDKTTRFSTKKYIAVSEHLKDRLIKSGIQPGKIRVIYNGIDFAEPAPRQQRKLVIGSVGRLHHVKGFDILLNAFSMLDNKRLRLKIAGYGDEHNNLKTLTERLGIADRVEFIANVKNIDDFLDSVDVYVQPSRSEGFGLSVVEAMSRELPIVVLPNGSLSEIIDDGQTGLVAKTSKPRDLAEAISKLVGDHELAKKLGQAARMEAMKKFSKLSWVNNTIDEYLKACK